MMEDSNVSIAVGDLILTALKSIQQFVRKYSSGREKHFHR
jgi:hypothetical protein